jgi:hypothetical protein
MGATNGTVTVTLASLPTTTLTTSDFTVSQAINGGTAQTVTPTSVSVSGTTATLTVPTVSATGPSQSVVDSVSLDGGSAVAASAFTVASSIDAVNSSVSFPTTKTITNGSPVNIVATVEDGSAQAVTGLTGSDFKLALGTQSLVGSAAVYLGSGQYQVTFAPQSMTAGSNLTATLTADGVQVGQDFGYTISAGSYSSSTTTVSYPAGSVLNTSATYTVTITPKDANGNPTTLSGSLSSVTLGTGTAAVALTGTSLSGPNSSNQYTVTFNAPGTTISTALPLVITIGSNTFTSSTSYTVAAQAVATATADFSGLPSTLYDGSTYQIPVTLTDANGNAVILPTANLNEFKVGYQGITSSAVTATASTTTPGVYDVPFSVTHSGAGEINGATAGAVSKITVTFTGGTSPISQVSSSSYTLSGSAATAVTGGAVTATWPTSTNMAVNTAYTATVTVTDSSGNPVSNLQQSDFSVLQNNTVTNLVTSVAPTSTAGQYTVTFTPTVTATSKTFTLSVDGTLTATSGSSFNIIGAVTADSVSLNNAVLVAGQSITVPVTVTGGSTNLGTSDFAISYNGTPVNVTAVSYDSTNSVYDVTFTAPNTTNSTGANLVFSVDGISTATNGTATGVTVEPLSAITIDSSLSWTHLTTGSITSGSTTYNAPASQALTTSTPYYIGYVAPTYNSNMILGIPASAFSATIGSTSPAALTISAVVPSTTTLGRYGIAVTTGTSTLTSSPINLTVDGVSASVTGFTVGAGAAAAYNSTVTFTTGNAANQLQAGQQYTITANLEDASGNPVSGAVANDFAIAMDNANTQTVIANGATATGGVTQLSVAAGSTAGSYTITFTMGEGYTGTPNTKLYLLYNNAGTAITTYSSSDLIGTSTVNTYTTIPATPNAITGLTYASASGLTVGTAGTLAVATVPQVTDAYGNVITDSGTYSIPTTTDITINSSTGELNLAAGWSATSVAVTYTQGGKTQTITVTL